jgi:hypothetical protein
MSTAKSCQAVVLFLLLAIPLPGFGQLGDPFDPVIGPLVRIVSPANHAVFFAPANIPIFAYVVDSPYTTNVEFYANKIDLGSGFSLGASNRPPGTVLPPFALPREPIACLGSIYCLVWTNAPAGAYALTAVTKERGIFVSNYNGDQSLSRTSAPVNITILPQVASTNGPSVVSIVAADPVAIVGSNSWVWLGPTNVTPAWTNWPPSIWQHWTNWGPRSALFTVRRCNSDSNAITVSYSVGGTASNGVDYVTLPGSVLLPAGQAYSLIPVVPIDHGAPYVPKTVVLTLTPATNTPPDYVVGFPNHAAAVIVHQWLRPLPFLLPDASFHLNAAGPDGAWFIVESSADLLHWSPVCTNQVFQGSIDFVDPDAPNKTKQFYQAVPLANPPSQ